MAKRLSLFVVAAAMFLFAGAGCSSQPNTNPPATQKTTATTQHSAPKPAGFAPRFNGLYASQATDDTRYYVRFFPDHTAYEVGTSVNTTPDDVRRWLGPQCKAEIPNGPWPYDAKGDFTSKTDGGQVDFSVKNFTRDGFDLHKVSHINGHVSTIHMTFSADPAMNPTVCPAS